MILVNDNKDFNKNSRKIKAIICYFNVVLGNSILLYKLMH